MRRALSTALLVGLVVLAGCLSGTPLTSGASDESDREDAARTGTVNLYVSDRPNAIGAFSHLNVTVTEVGLRTAGDADVEANASGDAAGNASADGSAANASGNGSARVDGGADAETEADGEWRTYDVDDRRVDLTELLGANATLLGDLSVPEGTYTGVYVEVSEVNGTLRGGERVNVKLPSERLRVHDRFTVGGEGESEVDFVFDMTVFEAGESGKYVLKPVASESGADQPFRAVATADAGVRARFVGPVEAGERATVKVTGPGGPVADAAVYVNGERVGETGGDGTVTVALPDGERSAELRVETPERGEATGTVVLDLAVRFGAGGDAAGGDASGDGTSDGGDEATAGAGASASASANAGANATGGADAEVDADAKATASVGI